jgi:hypothetical protein
MDREFDMQMNQVRFRLTSALLCSLVFVLLSGCGDDSKKAPKMKTIVGVAKTIDLKNNSVSMIYVNPEGQEITLTGSVQPDAEVWINGRSHKLEDVVQGDKVTVYGYRDKSSSEVKLIASKIEVTRPEGADWKKPDESAAAPGSAGSPGVTADSGGEK